MTLKGFILLFCVSLVNLKLTSSQILIKFSDDLGRILSNATVDSLDEIPKKIPKYADTIEVMGADMPIVKSGALPSVPQVYVVHLIASNIRDIQPGAFKNLATSDYISIRVKFNELREIKAGTFENLKLKLRMVDFSNNLIDTIAPTAFDDLTELLLIQLSNNKISRYDPAWFKNTPGLFHLHMEHNLIAEVPESAFKNFQLKRKINLTHFKYTSFSIFLEENRISKVGPDILNGIDEVMTFSLENNRIRNGIHKNAFRGVKFIKYLVLQKNFIDTWDGSLIDNTTNLYKVYLQDNQIRCLRNFDRALIAKHTYLTRNPLECECETKINVWQSQNHNKTIEFEENC